MDADTASVLKRQFTANTVTHLGRGCGGCISDGAGYDIDNGRLKVFVKQNKDDKVKIFSCLIWFAS